MLLPVDARYRHLDISRFLRGDAAFVRPALHRLLKTEGYQYAIRIPANDVLEPEISIGAPDRALRLTFRWIH